MSSNSRSSRKTYPSRKNRPDCRTACTFPFQIRLTNNAVLHITQVGQLKTLNLLVSYPLSLRLTRLFLSPYSSLTTSEMEEMLGVYCMYIKPRTLYSSAAQLEKRVSTKCSCTGSSISSSSSRSTFFVHAPFFTTHRRYQQLK